MRERNGNATLTKEEVRHIRGMLDRKEATAAELAKSYRMSAESIRRIGRRETWAWVTETPQLSDEDLRVEAQASQERLLSLLQDKGGERQLTPDEVVEKYQQRAREPIHPGEENLSPVERLARDIERKRNLAGDKLVDELKGDDDGRG